MRSLSATLTQAQKDMGSILCKIVLTSGANTYTYGVDTVNILMKATHTEQPYSQAAKVVIDNSDNTLTALSLEGYQGVISYGYTTSSGDEYSATAPLKVKAQELLSTGGVLNCSLALFGLPDQMDEDEASTTYAPDTTNTDTVKTIINAIAGATLACFNHCAAITVTYDSEDSLIDTFQPKDSFHIFVGETRLAKIKQLLGFTKCVMRAGADGAIHILSPTVSGVTYDYEYNDTVLSTNHTFFSKAYRNVLVLPNKVIVKDDAVSPTFAGTATSYSSFALLPKTSFDILAVSSTAQATAIATAKIQRAEQENERGSGFVPMNVGQEVHDYIKITDAREGDNRVGNIGYLTRTWDINARSYPYAMGFGFGNILLGNSIGQGATGRSPDSTVSYSDFTDFSNTMYKNFQIIFDYLEQTSKETVWVDETVPDDLDDVPDGSTYKRVLSTAITAGNIRLSEVVGNLDDVDDGITNGKILLTNLSAGNIKLTSAAVASGQWYNYSGVQINASAGINIFGTNNALVTRAAETSTIQCSVNSSGQITAGAGNVTLDANGITLAGAGTATNLRVMAGTVTIGWIYPIGNLAGGDGIALATANTTQTLSIAQGASYLGPGIGILGSPTEIDKLSSTIAVFAATTYASNTTYQNGNSYPIQVTVSLFYPGNGGFVRFYSSTVTPAATIVAECYNISGTTEYETVSFLVPTSGYFKWLNVDGASSITYWTHFGIGRTS